MGEMRDSDWSRKFLLRSDWLPIHVASMTTLYSFSIFMQGLSKEFPKGTHSVLNQS